VPTAQLTQVDAAIEKYPAAQLEQEALLALSAGDVDPAGQLPLQTVAPVLTS